MEPTVAVISYLAKMATRKWAEIKKLSKATEQDRAEARAELEVEIGRPITAGRTVQQILEQQDELAKLFEEFDPADGIERPVEECLEERRRKSGIDVGQ